MQGAKPCSACHRQASGASGSGCRPPGCPFNDVLCSGVVTASSLARLGPRSGALRGERVSRAWQSGTLRSATLLETSPVAPLAMQFGVVAAGVRPARPTASSVPQPQAELRRPHRRVSPPTAAGLPSRAGAGTSGSSSRQAAAAAAAASGPPAGGSLPPPALAAEQLEEIMKLVALLPPGVRGTLEQHPRLAELLEVRGACVRCSLLPAGLALCACGRLLAAAHSLDLHKPALAKQTLCHAHAGGAGPWPPAARALPGRRPAPGGAAGVAGGPPVCGGPGGR